MAFAADLDRSGCPVLCKRIDIQSAGRATAGGCHRPCHRLPVAATFEVPASYAGFVDSWLTEMSSQEVRETAALTGHPRQA